MPFIIWKNRNLHLENKIEEIMIYPIGIQDIEIEATESGPNVV